MTTIRFTREAVRRAEILRDAAIHIVAPALFVSNSMLPERHHGKRRHLAKSKWQGANLDAIVNKLDREEATRQEREDRERRKAEKKATLGTYRQGAENEQIPYAVDEDRLYRNEVAFAKALGLITEDDLNNLED